MSTFANSFKAEVIRLARKEAKAAVSPIRKPAGATRKVLADLKQRVATLEKECRRLSALLGKVPQPQAEPAEEQKVRITGKGMRSLRRKLGLSAIEFGKLLGVSRVAVYQWERKEGPLRVRGATMAAILSIKSLGAREAKERLAALTDKTGAKGKQGGRG